MNVRIKRTTYDQIKFLKPYLLKERMRMYNTKGSVWFCAVVHGKIVGIVGLAPSSKDAMLLKSGYVLKNYRRRGVLTKIYKPVMNYLRTRGTKKVAAYCMRSTVKFLSKDGFKIKRFIRSKGGITYMEKRINTIRKETKK